MNKLKKLSAFALAGLMSIGIIGNCPIQAANESTEPTVEIDVNGPGTVTVTNGDDSKTISNDKISESVSAGTELKISAKAEEEAIIDIFTVDEKSPSDFSTASEFEHKFKVSENGNRVSVVFKQKPTTETTQEKKPNNLMEKNQQASTEAVSPAKDKETVPEIKSNSSDKSTLLNSNDGSMDNGTIAVPPITNGSIWIIGEDSEDELLTEESIVSSESTLNITANDGFIISAFVVDGKTVAPPTQVLTAAEITFKESESNHSFEVKFEKSDATSTYIAPIRFDLDNQSYNVQYWFEPGEFDFTEEADTSKWEGTETEYPAIRSKARARASRAAGGYSGWYNPGENLFIGVNSNNNVLLKTMQASRIWIKNDATGTNTPAFCIDALADFYSGGKTAYYPFRGELDNTYAGMLGNTNDQKLNTIKRVALVSYWCDNYMASWMQQNYPNYRMNDMQKYFMQQVLIWRSMSQHGNGNWFHTNIDNSVFPHYIEGPMIGAALDWSNGQDLSKYSYDATIYYANGQPCMVAKASEVKKGAIAVVKRSSNTSISSGNNCYSLVGAQYKLYSDAACTKEVHTFNLNSTDGDNKVFDGPYELDLGTYYLKETKAAKGYALDPNVITVKVEANGVTHPNGMVNWKDIEVKDVPQSDPVGILLGKVDKETNANKPQGSASLADAQFTVKFFAGENPNTSGTPTRQWVLKTDEKGYVFLKDNYKVSGDEFYKDSKGNTTLPLGTVTLQETKAPDGYYINSQIFTVKITSNGNAEAVQTYNQPVVPEQSINLILTKEQIGTKTPIQGTVFTHTKPDGSTEDLVADANGKISLKGLQSGQHKLKEKSVMAGYQINPNEFVFTVDQNGIKAVTSDLSGKNMEFNAGNTTGTAASLTVYDAVTPPEVKIIKVNENDKILPGAEFTIYSDQDCTKVVQKLTTDSTGVLQFDKLQDRTDYWFKETKAPDGYRIPVDSQGNQHVYQLRIEATPAKNECTLTVDGKTYTAKDTSGSIHLEDDNGTWVASITVINYTSGKLPETGSPWGLYLAGTAAACALIWIVINRRKVLK
ncbi:MULTISPECIES: MSCRAMM family protein [Erysipelotrichaceae]|uniref:MSCRAMM family protein n=1 Tax=Erysipelotrichaceae TaxID=128827 RepID=UPI00259B8BDF|nr:MULTISPECIES: SpaA isopeptide-forming pilin-related protein [Erysipelotrichaceae]